MFHKSQLFPFDFFHKVKSKSLSISSFDFNSNPRNSALFKKRDYRIDKTETLRYQH